MATCSECDSSHDHWNCPYAWINGPQRQVYPLSALPPDFDEWWASLPTED